MKTYNVYDPETEDLLTSGTASQCAKQLGITRHGFQSALERVREGRSKKYRITETGEIPSMRENRNPVDKDIQAIKAWDAFYEPLRKEFGIPVYRANKERR